MPECVSGGPAKLRPTLEYSRVGYLSQGTQQLLSTQSGLECGNRFPDEGDVVSTGFRTLLSTERVEEHDRRLEILLLEKLEPLHSVKTCKYIGPFIDILQSAFKLPSSAAQSADILHTALSALSEEGIFHRDISTGNLMLRRLPGPEGRLQGVLSDFDLAIDMKDENMTTTSHLHRTGTLSLRSLYCSS